MMFCENVSLKAACSRGIDDKGRQMNVDNERDQILLGLGFELTSFVRVQTTVSQRAP